MFINVTTRQKISIYSIGPYWYLLACTPTFGKVGGTKIFFSLAPLANPVLYPHLKIRGAAHEPRHCICTDVSRGLSATADSWVSCCVRPTCRIDPIEFKNATNNVDGYVCRGSLYGAVQPVTRHWRQSPTWQNRSRSTAVYKIFNPMVKTSLC